ncbi:hypothetical protein ABZ341_32575 [Streptomyces sp. NPDC006173]|uniref:hypothetical protein n=1 Tax=Streptomyces sp. NPDC006173 TaxID=3155349 RepID=UPI0033C018C4
MRCLLWGALAGLLLAFPWLLELVVTAAAFALAHPVLIAFGLGVAVAPRLPRLRRRSP